MLTSSYNKYLPDVVFLFFLLTPSQVHNMRWYMCNSHMLRILSPFLSPALRLAGCLGGWSVAFSLLVLFSPSPFPVCPLSFFWFSGSFCLSRCLFCSNVWARISVDLAYLGPRSCALRGGTARGRGRARLPDAAHKNDLRLWPALNFLSVCFVLYMSGSPPHWLALRHSSLGVEGNEIYVLLVLPVAPFWPWV